MIDEKKVQRAVEEFIENPYWKKMLDTAPTEVSRRYTELDFYYSEGFGNMSAEERKEVVAEQDALTKKFGLEDWKHACRYAGNNPFRGKCIREIGKRGGGDWLEEHFGMRFGY